MRRGGGEDNKRLRKGKKPNSSRRRGGSHSLAPAVMLEVICLPSTFRRGPDAAPPPAPMHYARPCISKKRKESRSCIRRLPSPSTSSSPSSFILPPLSFLSLPFPFPRYPSPSPFPLPLPLPLHPPSPSPTSLFLLPPPPSPPPSPTSSLQQPRSSFPFSW